MILTGGSGMILVGVIAAVVAYFGTPLAGRLAGFLGMLDAPGDRKMHKGTVPYLGGVAILAGWLIAFLTPGTLTQSVVLVGGMTILGIVGFIDDRYDSSESRRLVVQILVATLAYAGGVRMTPTDVAAVDFLLTILWLVGITNAFNFMDNMDGLAAGVGGIAALFLGINGLLFGQKLVSVLGFCFAGSCAGFLRHNFHPAKIFMGDTGSLPLGFGLAVLAIKVQFPGVHPLVAAAVPVVTLGLFVIDTTVMTLGRIVRGEKVVGARLDHISHRMLKKDFPVHRIALLMYAAAGLLGAAGLALSQSPTDVALPLLGVILAVGAVATFVVLRWPVLRGMQRPAVAEEAIASLASS